MKHVSLTITSALLAGAFWALAAGPSDDLIAAAHKLSDQPNYSWKQTTEMAGGGNGGRGPGPTEGKIEKGGYAVLSMARGENTIQAVIKGDKGAIKLGDEWQSAEEAAQAAGNGGGGGGNPGRFFARTVKMFKSPAAQVEYLASKMKEVRKTDSGFAGEMTEDGAKELLSLGGRGGGEPPSVQGAKGNATFWVKSGELSKYTFQVQGSVTYNGNNRDVDRTTTVEIKGVGTTQVEVPEAAKKKAS